MFRSINYFVITLLYILAPYGAQSTANMQGYSGQPIFYPNPQVPQVLVQQAYPNIPSSSVSYHYSLYFLNVCIINDLLTCLKFLL